MIYHRDGRLRDWTGLVVLLIVTFLCYGLYAKHMTFYWDDWSFAWPRQFLGGQEFTAWPTRPLRVYVERFLTPLLGVDPLIWQIAAIFARYMAAVSLWWALGRVWPRRSPQTFMVALLYVVYPGFSQQPLAMTYLYFWLVQIVFFASLGVMVWAIRHPRFRWLALSGALVGAVLQMFACEYFVGLELLRPFLLWIVLGDSFPRWKERFSRLLLCYAPFAVVLGIYLYWRLEVVSSPFHQPVLLNQLRSDPGSRTLELLKTIWHAIGVVTVGAWENALQVDLGQCIYRVKTIFPALIVVSTIGLILYLHRMVPSKASAESTGCRWRQAWQFVGVGLVGLLVAGIPCYVGDFIVSSSFEADRFS